MNNLKCTANQMLLLDKNELYRNQTIDMSLKLNCHIDNKVLVQAVNKEIERNDCLRLHVYRRFFSWYNMFNDVYTIDEIKTFDQTHKTDEEVRTFIDSLCTELIVLKKAKYPFEIYQIVTDDGDYVLFRILHVNMDAYSTLFTLADIVKVYFSLLNNTPLTDKITSVKGFIENTNNNIEKVNKKIKEDTEYFINKNKELGEPTYTGCEGGYDGSNKRFKISVFKNHPVAYYENKIEKDFAGKLLDYCSKNVVNVAALYLSAIELYLSAVNNNYKDISMFYTSDFRSKLSEKSMPLTNSTSIFFRRLIDEDISISKFIKDCDNEYMQTLKHVSADIAKVYQYLINLKLLDINGRYDQIVYSYIPVKFDGLPQDISIEPYWPKTKGASDFIIYYIVVPNPDGSFNTFYRYFTDVLKKEDVEKLHAGITKVFELCISNPDMKVSEVLANLK